MAQKSAKEWDLGSFFSTLWPFFPTCGPGQFSMFWPFFSIFGFGLWPVFDSMGGRLTRNAGWCCLECPRSPLLWPIIPLLQMRRLDYKVTSSSQQQGEENTDKQKKHMKEFGSRRALGVFWGRSLGHPGSPILLPTSCG